MKKKTLAILMLPLLAGVCSCGSKTPGEAESMLQSIRDDMSAGRFDRAIVAMDSLDSRFPDATAIRSEALKIRPAAIEGATIAEIATADSTIAAVRKTIDSLSSLFDHVVNHKLVENYYVIRSARKPDIMTSTAIEPRVDEDFNFYLICSLQGKNIGLNSLTLSTGSASATTNTIPEGDERSFASALGQKAVFSEADAEDLGRLALASRGADGTLTFNGRSGSKNLRLSASDLRAIADSYQFSQAHKSLVLAQIRREKLERQLQIARNQMANMTASPES